MEEARWLVSVVPQGSCRSVVVHLVVVVAKLSCRSRLCLLGVRSRHVIGDLGIQDHRGFV